MSNRLQQRDTDQAQRLINRSLRKLMAPAPVIGLCDINDQTRGALESFIADKFHQTHGARIDQFLPLILSLRDSKGYHAALGLRPACDDTLFLEQYLSAPAPQTIAAIAKTPVDRNAIVEIGNLVSAVPGATALLFMILVAMLHKSRFEYVMFTATPEVKRAIQLLGFTIESICVADPARLNGDSSNWGSYYDNRPEVMVGFITESIQRCGNNPLIAEILSAQDAPISLLSQQIKQAS